METVWKYRVPFDDKFSLDMPRGAQILTMQLQDGVLTIWARVETENETEPRHFVLVGTGNPIPVEDTRTLVYINTLQIAPFVFHLFEATSNIVILDRYVVI